MAKGIWRRVGLVAVPVGADSLEFLLAHKDGDEFIADTHGARNLRQLKLFWALVDLCVDATDQPKTTVKNSLAIRLGYWHIETSLDGVERVVADSIACEKMTQEVFNEFFKSAVEVIAGWLGNSPIHVMDRFNQMIAEKRGYQEMRRR